MRYQIFRNFTVELLFNNLNCTFSDYGDVSQIDFDAERYIWFYLPEPSFGRTNISNETDNYINMLEYVISKISDSKKLIIFRPKNIFKLNLEPQNLGETIEEYINAIAQLEREHKNVIIFPFDEFLSNYSSENLIDFKYFFSSRIIINPKLTKPFTVWFEKEIKKIEGRSKKCLVLDLDNTLWGGVLGEDGISGIKIGGDYPGFVFQLFQEYLIELNRLGVLLTICSKNNEADVIEVFEKNENLKLKIEHFIHLEINWKNKAENIMNIAENLNIGLDSLVFIDDNPMERELVKRELPEVCVPDFPKNLYDLPILLKNISEYFLTYNITQEDLNKTNQYKQNQVRNRESKKFTDLDTFIRSLNIEITISDINEFNIERLVQLTHKTNQFNLTTKRYSSEDLLLLSSNNGTISAVQVKDKFGDYGIVGLFILKIDKDSDYAEIDSFLLSCRILGKGIEHEVMNHIVQFLKKEGISVLKGKYISTKKNSQVANFYDQFNFEIIMESSIEREYELKLNSFLNPKQYNHKINHI